MARKMSLRGFLNSENPSRDEDELLIHDVAAEYGKVQGELPQGIYFLLDDSYILFLGGKQYKNPQ